MAPRTNCADRTGSEHYAYGGARASEWCVLATDAIAVTVKVLLHTSVVRLFLSAGAGAGSAAHESFARHRGGNCIFQAARRSRRPCNNARKDSLNCTTARSRCTLRFQGVKRVGLAEIESAERRRCVRLDGRGFGIVYGDPGPPLYGAISDGFLIVAPSAKTQRLFVQRAVS